MINLIEELKKIDLAERFALDNKKIILILIASLAVIYFDFNFLLKNQISRASKTKAEIIKIRNGFKSLDAGLKAMEAAKAREKSSPKAKEKKVIFESELTALLHDISKIANANNVRLFEIKPSRDAKKGANGKFAPVAISMNLICGYHDFGKFLNGLENNRVFIAAESFKIEAQPGDPLKQKISLTVKTYVRE